MASVSRGAGSESDPTRIIGVILLNPINLPSFILGGLPCLPYPLTLCECEYCPSRFKLSAKDSKLSRFHGWPEEGGLSIYLLQGKILMPSSVPESKELCEDISRTETTPKEFTVEYFQITRNGIGTCWKGC